MLMDTAWQQQWGIEYAPSLAEPQLWTRPYVMSYAQYDNMTAKPGSDEALIYDAVQRKWGEILPRLLLAKSDSEFDTIWTDFQTYKKDQGWDKVQAYQTSVLNSNKKKLGL
jgi:putative aldouronate transport system substrate-binding protein